MSIERMRALRLQFADALAAHLGRPVGTIRARGLSASDFPGDRRVELTFRDGSFMSLRYAFYVVDEGTRALGVFTEHLGYHAFAAHGLTVRVRSDDDTLLGERTFD